MKLRIAFLGTVIGFAIASACGTAPSCSLGNCATGCCNSAGACLAGDEQTACGVSAGQCTSCAASQFCSAHACVTGTAPVIGVALNEIAALGAEFVELYVTASGDLSNYALADSESDGGPKLGGALRFPSGSTFATGTFITVVTGKNDAGVSTQCPGGATACFSATYGISNSRGETVWLISPTGAVIDSKPYPANGADAGSSIGRLPNGTGAWQVNTPATPGSTN